MNTTETTCVIIKPDGVKRGLTGDIIKRIEQMNLKVVNIQMFRNTAEAVYQQYPPSDLVYQRFGEKTISSYAEVGWNTQDDFQSNDAIVIGKLVHGWLVDYLTSAPMIKLAVQGAHAISLVRKLIGETMPYRADIGTIRGDYSNDSPAIANHNKRVMWNIIHASENEVEARNELALYFANQTFNY